MTDNELKRSLIAKINQIQDHALLKALLVLLESQPGTPANRYAWGNASGRNLLDRQSTPEPGDCLASENFFEDMEQLLRDNH